MTHLKNSKPFCVLIIFSIFLITLSGCEEVAPFINLKESTKHLKDTSYIISNLPVSKEKNMLLEYVSGVNCVACPAAAKKAQSVIDNKGNRIIVVTHIPDKSLLPRFTDPKNIFTDLTNNKANQLMDFITPPSGLPVGMINRGDFGNGRTIIWQSWDGPIDQELSKSTSINLDLQNSYDIAKNEVIVSVKITYLSNQIDTLQNISVLITENDIKGVQSDLNGINDDYTFNHIMRDFATNALGDPLNTKLQAGRVIERQYRIKMNSKWIVKNCNIVAIVHSRQKKDVYQSTQEKVF